MKIVIYTEKLEYADFLRDFFEKNKITEVLIFCQISDCKTYFKYNEIDMFFAYASESMIEFVKNKDIFMRTAVFLFGEKSREETFQNYGDKIFVSEFSKEDFELCCEICHIIKRRFCSMPKALTFGSFDLFINNEPVCFHNKKAKELFALCIDKMGGTVSMYEAIDLIWQCQPDAKVKKCYRNAVGDIRKALGKYGLSGIFYSSKGECHINKANIKSDYFDFMEEPQKNMLNFKGEYMPEYSWGEKTLSKLEKIYYNTKIILTDTD